MGSPLCWTCACSFPILYWWKFENLKRIYPIRCNFGLLERRTSESPQIHQLRSMVWPPRMQCSRNSNSRCWTPIGARYDLLEAAGKEHRSCLIYPAYLKISCNYQFSNLFYISLLLLQIFKLQINNFYSKFPS